MGIAEWTYGDLRADRPPDVEQLVLDGIRAHLESTEVPIPAVERDLIERQVDRIIVRPHVVEVQLDSGSSNEPVPGNCPGEC